MRVKSPFFLILFIIIVPIGYFILFKHHNEALKDFNDLKISGIVQSKTYLNSEKPLFLKIDSTWYGILTLRVEEFVERGDSLIKKGGTDCIYVKKGGNFSNFEIFCNSYASIVVSKRIINKLNKIVLEKKEQTDRLN